MDAREAINALFEGKAIKPKGSSYVYRILPVGNRKCFMTEYSDNKFDVSNYIHLDISMEHEIVE